MQSVAGNGNIVDKITSILTDNSTVQENYELNINGWTINGYNSHTLSITNTSGSAVSPVCDLAHDDSNTSVMVITDSDKNNLLQVSDSWYFYTTATEFTIIYKTTAGVYIPHLALDCEGGGAADEYNKAMTEENKEKRSLTHGWLIHTDVNNLYIVKTDATSKKIQCKISAA